MTFCLKKGEGQMDVVDFWAAIMNKKLIYV